MDAAGATTWAFIQGVTDAGELVWSVPLLQGKGPDETQIVAHLGYGESVKILRRDGEKVLVETVLGQSGWVPARFVRELGEVSRAELPIMALAVDTAISPAFLLDLERAIALLVEMGRIELASRLESAARRLRAGYDVLVAPLARA